MVRLLAAERQRQGVSMNSLAAKSGLSQSFISMFESQPANPTLDTLLRISEALGLDAGEILRAAIQNTRREARSSRAK
ncbi:MAG TPA: helix-turn-helix transcriptional regulator [Verrucomicrobiota bacterium]|nr:helix-turn-helix transcriptional regulator [Verrucomicrobiota bacterium]